jgi:hypothetical protein
VNVPFNAVAVAPTVIWPEHVPVTEPSKSLTTVIFLGALIIPPNIAVMLVIPGASALTKPLFWTIVPVLEISQVTLSVMSTVEPSEYLPVAVSCMIDPTDISAGEDDLISMEDSFGKGFDAHALMPKFSQTNSPIVR